MKLTHPTQQQLLEACKALGLDGSTVASVTMTPRTVDVEVFDAEAGYAVTHHLHVTDEAAAAQAAVFPPATADVTGDEQA